MGRELRGSLGSQWALEGSARPREAGGSTRPANYYHWYYYDYYYYYYYYYKRAYT